MKSNRFFGDNDEGVTVERKPVARYMFSKAQLASPVVLSKAEQKSQSGPFIGPRGGKWADPDHTVPYKMKDYNLSVTGKESTKVGKNIEHGIKAAADACKQAPPLCHGNLGIPRDKMPQLPGDIIPEFLASFQKAGTKVTKEKMMVGMLKATQGEINSEKVAGMAFAKEQGKYDPSKAPIIVSKDGYVLDGHHRWAATLLDNPSNEMNVYKVDTGIKELLKKADETKGVQYQSFGDKSAGVKEERKTSPEEQAGIDKWLGKLKNFDNPLESKQGGESKPKSIQEMKAATASMKQERQGLSKRNQQMKRELNKPKPKQNTPWTNEAIAKRRQEIASGKRPGESMAAKSIQMHALAAAIKDEWEIGRAPIKKVGT